MRGEVAGEVHAHRPETDDRHLLLGHALLQR
jgi:hypothetical protein